MKKTDWQYLIDSLLFINIVGIVIIGFLLGLVIPEGPSVAERSKYFFGLLRHDWGHIHFYLSIAFTVLVIIHLIFSWKWIKAKAKQIFKNGWRTSLIIVLFLALLTPLLFWNFWPKYADTHTDYGFGQGNRDLPLESQERYLPQEGEGYVVVTGQMSIADLEKATGISSQSIIEKLDLPKRTKLNETLGLLRKRFGFQLQDVRDIITKLLAESYPSSEKQETGSEDVVPEKISAAPEIQKEANMDEEKHKDKITRGMLTDDKEAVLISGQMTFSDREKQTGIQARRLAEELGLPPTISSNERIGRLRRMHKITIQDIRDAVSTLLKEPEKVLDYYRK
ncbi:DUF4405 domain-containing protein [Acidobacteriota bacterium]